MPRGYKAPYRKPQHHKSYRGQPSSTLRVPPTPPASCNPHFLVIEYAHSWVNDTLYVACTSDVACHMYLRWTSVPMGVHNRVTTLGGYSFMTDPKYCMVQYNEVEQNEAGDTLTHTFNFAGWAECEWRWWYIVGTLGGEPSPSATCIFQAHYMDQEEAESLLHTDLQAKEVAGVIDHADNSVTADKLEHDLNGVPIGLNADKLDGLHAAELGGSWPLLYASAGQYYEWNLDSIDGFYKSTNLTASIALEWNRLHVQTGGANLADATIRKYLRPPDRLLTWDKVRRMICLVCWQDDTLQDSELLIGTDVAHYHVGWRIDNNRLLLTRRGATGWRSNDYMAIVPGTVYLLEVIHVPAYQVYWKINGVQVFGSDRDQPSGIDHAQLPFAFRLYAKEAINKQAEVYGFRFVQEP